MDEKGVLDEIYDESFEKTLPPELLDNYYILECLNSADGCYTLLLADKRTDARVVAKCYSKESPLFDAAELNLLSDSKSDAIPHFEGEYCNAEYRCVLREYVEGISLYDYAKSRRLSEEEILEIAVRLAQAMQKLHEQEQPIIHRDIKPQNIIIKNDGSIVLIDLGISRVYKKNEKEDTVLAGTPVFSSPEQYGFMQTDIRSDIYSFGVVLSWMLTGKIGLIREPQTRLEKIAGRCCAFAPEKRFKNDSVLLEELQKATPEYQRERSWKRKSLCVSVLTLLLGLLLGVVGHMVVSDRNLSGEKRVKFKEPLIEQAVRVMLDKPEGAIRERELNYVMGIYINGNNIYTSSSEFFDNVSVWIQEGMVYGDISDLSDLELMPNLRDVCIGGQHISDISPLAKLEQLETVDLHRNEIEDISPLAGKQRLFHMGFSFNKLTDIETISTCPVLSGLDLRSAGSFDGSPVATLGQMQFIDIVCDSDAYEYLGGKDIREIKYGAPGQTDIECIRDVAHVERVHVGWSEIRDISALAGREDVLFLSSVGGVLDDVSPIFTLPFLQRLEIDEQNREMFEDYVKEHNIDYNFEVVFI